MGADSVEGDYEQGITASIGALNIYNGDALLLYGGRKVLRQTLVSGQMGFFQDKATAKHVNFFDVGRFDIVFLNPPYRNLVRDHTTGERSFFRTVFQVKEGPW